MKQKSLKLFLTKNDTVHYTLCYTPDKSRCNLLFYNDIFLLKLLIILWSTVQVCHALTFTSFRSLPHPQPPPRSPPPQTAQSGQRQRSQDAQRALQGPSESVSMQALGMAMHQRSGRGLFLPSTKLANTVDKTGMNCFSWPRWLASW